MRNRSGILADPPNKPTSQKARNSTPHSWATQGKFKRDLKLGEIADCEDGCGLAGLLPLTTAKPARPQTAKPIQRNLRASAVIDKKMHALKLTFGLVVGGGCVRFAGLARSAAPFGIEKIFPEFWQSRPELPPAF
jgi:hypothetical protein